jgi:hypothetical protein
MKRLFIFITFTIFSICDTLAQEAEHFTFKGIPIDGSVSNFAEQLVSDGYSKVNSNTYRGKFLRNDCAVTIVADDDNMVWRIAATFASIDTWNDLESSFNSYVSLYSEKYGKPKSLFKEFSTRTGDSTYRKMIAIDEGNCKYTAYWELPQGSIEVKIVEGNRYDTGSIRIIYTDSSNKSAVHKSDLDEI